MATLQEIDKLTERYADLRGKLSHEVAELSTEVEGAKRRRLPAVKRLVQRAKEAEAELRAAIEDSAALFEKPRTQVLHGIKVGFQKGKGKIEWDDAEQVVRLIKKHFPEQADVLISTKEKPAKDALAQLTAAELKRLGIEVGDTGDVVLIRDTASDVDKLVTALLKEDTEEAEA